AGRPRAVPRGCAGHRRAAQPSQRLLACRLMPGLTLPGCDRSTAPLIFGALLHILPGRHTMTQASPPGLASEAVLRRTMIAVVFGGLMSMLDTTIVHIAL